MMTPEERAACARWRARQYPEHYAHMRRVAYFRKRGAADPVQAAIDAKAKADAYKAQMEAEKDNFELHMERIMREANERDRRNREKYLERKRLKKLQKQNEAYLAYMKRELEGEESE
jgi:hypothetical protein